MKRLLLILMVAASSADAQIGWTIDQCRKHWGHESHVGHSWVDGSHPTTSTTYAFGVASKIEKEVTFDQHGKLNDVYYVTHFEDNDDEMLRPKIQALLAREEGVIWESEGHTSRHEYWIGKKDGVEVFHARYFTGHDAEGRWAESLHVLPIESPLDPPPVSKSDTDWVH